MRLADRRFIQVTVSAWIFAYAAILVTILRAGLPVDADSSLLAFGVVFVGLAAALLTVIVVAIPLRIILNLTLKDRRRSHRTETIVLTVVLALVIGHTLEVSRERNRLAPPRGVTQLSDFAKLAPPPRRLELLQHDGDEYVVWFGELSGPIDLPSGPSCYLFDRHGELVKWQPETGDGGPVEEILRSSSRAGEISLEDAVKGFQNSDPVDAENRDK